MIRRRCLQRVWAMGLALGVGLLEGRVAEGAEENLALHRPVSSSGANWGSFKPAALTDGDPSTFTHPADSSGTTGFTYEVDLGATRRLERIVLRNRQDGCCPERLTRVRVEVWSDSGGATGERRWSAALRADGTHSGVGGVDTLTAELDETGDFSGRFIRIVNTSGAAYNPQLAEIEAYGGAVPVIQSFVSDEDVLEKGASTVLRWTIENATGATLEPGLGAIPATRGDAKVSPTSTTLFTLVATNEHGSATAMVRIGVGVVLLPPELTEFVAATGNDTEALEDEDGDTSDWLEIFNPNPYSLRMGGYGLTDGTGTRGAWVFPEVRIAPQSFRIVFASSKDRRDPAGPLHTDFRLDDSGESIALLDRNLTTILGRFPELDTGLGHYPPQSAGASYGVGEGGRVGFLRPPTPGRANGPAFDGVVEPVRFTHARGLYDTDLLVTIATATPGATIRYTTNRTEPTAARGNVSTAPLRITGTTVLRAAAFRPGWAPAETVTHTYVFPSNVIASGVMRRSVTTHATYGPQLAAALQDLPSVSLVADGAVGDSAEVGGSVEWIPSRSDVDAGWAMEGGVQAGCGIRLFGGAFTDFAKKSFRLYFRRTYGPGRFRAPLFRGFERGLAAAESFDQLELRSGSHDMAMRGFYLGNAFTDDTMLEMGHLNPHGRFVHLYLNGEYWGVYHLRERWGASMHATYLGGESENYESINGNWNVGGWAEPGVPYDGDGSAWARVKALRSYYPALRDSLDVPQFVDYMLMWMFGGSEDEYRCVGPTVPGSGFKFHLNDADGWFCIPSYCEAGNRTSRGAPGRQAGDGPGSLFSMLHASGDPEYRMLLADRIQRAMTLGGPLTPERNRERLLRRSGEFERPMLAEWARWGFLSPTEWRTRRDFVLNNWLSRRTSEVQSQFRSAGFLPSLAAPTFSHAGGEVPPGFDVRVLGPASGTVLFTLDGSDPRLAAGGSSAGSSFRVDQNIWVRARTRNGSQWSPVAEAYYRVGDALRLGDVVIREIDYHPAGTNAVEFVELESISTRTVNLRGARFVDGIEYAFPADRDVLLAPGRRWVLAEEVFGMHRRHGPQTRVDATFKGRLNNAGERIRLVREDGETVVSFEYRPLAPWPELADGGGHTLVLAHPDRGANDPMAWRPSVNVRGTPGTGDSVRFAGDPDADADGDGLPAAVEYALGTDDTDAGSGREALTAEVDVDGRFLVRVSRNPGADDVRLGVDFSTDLRSWFPATRRAWSTVSAGRAEEIWGVTGTGFPNVFIRVSVIR